jgi:CRISPR-associated exonuclease Cas4
MLSLLLVVAIAAVAALWVMRGRRGGLRRTDLEWLPAELCDGELVWSEQTFRSDEPVPMIARIDRAYRTAEHGLTLVESKWRGVRRAFASDVVELSAQRYVMQRDTS